MEKNSDAFYGAKPSGSIFSLYNYQVRVGNIPKALSFRSDELEMNKSLNKTLFDHHGFSIATADYLRDDDGDSAIIC